MEGSSCTKVRPRDPLAEGAAQGWCHSGSALCHPWAAPLGLQAGPQLPGAQDTWGLPSSTPLPMSPHSWDSAHPGREETKGPRARLGSLLPRDAVSLCLETSPGPSRVPEQMPGPGITGRGAQSSGARNSSQRAQQKCAERGWMGAPETWGAVSGPTPGKRYPVELGARGGMLGSRRSAQLMSQRAAQQGRVTPVPFHQEGCLRDGGVGPDPWSLSPTGSPAPASSPVKNPVTWGLGDSRFRSVWQPRKPTGIWLESPGHQHELGQAGSRGAVVSAGPLGLHSTGSH